MNRRFDVYAAGLVDGEGCITAKSTKSQTGMGIRVLIGMSTKADMVLERMRDTYGGTLITQEPKNEAHARITTWTVNGSTAATFLRAIEPHLILKAEQASVALKIEQIRTSQQQIGSRGHYRWTPDAMERCEVLRRRLNELNERGREPSPTSGTPFARLVAGQWVTDQADLFSDLGWEPYSQTWPASGYMRDGSAFELPTSAHHTTANDCSSWFPTPTATPYGSNQSPSPGAAVRPSLDGLVRTLPTPQASNGNGGKASKHVGGRRPSGAKRAIELTDLPKMLPTPRTTDANGPGKHGTGGMDLRTAIAELSGAPTPPLFDVGNE